MSRYFLGILDTDYCITSLKTNVGRLLFLTIWLTKLENQDNKTTYLADMRIFKYNNLWEIICFDSLGLVCDKIEELWDNGDKLFVSTLIYFMTNDKHSNKNDWNMIKMKIKDLYHK